MTKRARGTGIGAAVVACVIGVVGLACAADGGGRVYEAYEWKPEYKDKPLTYGAFAIIAGEADGLPAVCIKQRDGKGSSPYLFDLPGGGVEVGKDPDHRAAVVREVLEELNVRCEVVAAIGEPLYLPRKRDGSIVSVDSAQAYLVRTADKPVPRAEAISVAFVHAQSIAGFRVAGVNPDPKSPAPGRTPVMLFDGLSILQKPFYRGEITAEIRSRLTGEKAGSDFVLVDGGRYLGRMSSAGEGSGRKQQITLYYRLNPEQPDGRFRGSLDHLAR